VVYEPALSHRVPNENAAPTGSRATKKGRPWRPPRTRAPPVSPFRCTGELAPAVAVDCTYSAARSRASWPGGT